MVIKNRLKEMRLAYSLSQMDLAESIGVSKNAISSYERGEYYPSLPVLLQLCFLFGCSSDQLFWLLPDNSSV